MTSCARLPRLVTCLLASEPLAPTALRAWLRVGTCASAPLPGSSTAGARSLATAAAVARTFDNSSRQGASIRKCLPVYASCHSACRQVCGWPRAHCTAIHPARGRAVARVRPATTSRWTIRMLLPTSCFSIYTGSSVVAKFRLHHRSDRLLGCCTSIYRVCVQRFWTHRRVPECTGPTLAPRNSRAAAHKTCACIFRTSLFTSCHQGHARPLCRLGCAYTAAPGALLCGPGSAPAARGAIPTAAHSQLSCHGRCLCVRRRAHTSVALCAAALKRQRHCAAVV